MPGVLATGGFGRKDVGGFMTRTKWWCLVGGLSFLAAVGLFCAVQSFQHGGNVDLAVQPPKGGATADGEGESAERYVMVGGVRRRASDIEPIKQPRDDEASKALRKARDYGATEPVDPKTNPHTQSVAEALRDGEHPERLSVLLRPAKFDFKAFKANPKEYLNAVEPGRAFQSAEPGPAVARLAAITARRIRVVQGDEVALQVAAAPDAPVTFTSFDLGTFHNGLTTVTVQADKHGVAEAKFTGGPGTIANVHVQAASPVNSGQVRFTVHITRADEVAEN